MKASVRDVVILDSKGNEVFRQNNVEAPESWSDTAVSIFASKYFYGKQGTPERETSIYKTVDRVVNTITEWGWKDNYFKDEKEREAFGLKLRNLLLEQKTTFNSPVWFSLGLPGKNTSSACFILEVEDNIESIVKWWETETFIFNAGSGSGINVSKLRSCKESLSGGGRSSGPVSFMRAADNLASVIKSAGRVRRASKLVVMDDNHPDIEEFIDCKVKAEEYQRVINKAGLSDRLDDDSFGVPFQSSNHSIRITDEFMWRVENDKDWATFLINTPNAMADAFRARKLFDKMIDSIWEVGDPGFQFTDTINAWNTVRNDGEILSSNPCIRKGSEILTREGYIKIEDLDGLEVDLFDGIGYSKGKVWKNGRKKIIRLHFGNGYLLGLTEDHRVYTNKGWIAAKDSLGLFVYRLEADGFHKDIITWVEDLGIEDEVYDFSNETTHIGLVNGIVVHNCGEHLHLNNTACNLASLKLTAFYNEYENKFNIDEFLEAVEIMITAQDILIDNSDFPTDLIKQNSMKYRPLGLGFTDLGGLIMKMQYSYDSLEGRQIAASIASLMTAQAYLTSYRLACKKGPFEAFDRNKDHMMKVLEKHERAIRDIEGPITSVIVSEIRNAAMGIWNYIFINCDRFRNSQVTLLAPQGTTGLTLDSSTLGVEPEFSLVRYKTMAGGGYVSFINPIFKDVLLKLGYSPDVMGMISESILESKNLEDSNLIEKLHLPIFDCALPISPGGRCLSPEAHIKMLATIQPNLSSGISKTINLPNDITKEKIAELTFMAWRSGVKGLTFYRDGCKVYQPLSTKKVEDKKEEVKEACPIRKKLPSDCESKRHKFRIGEIEGYLHCGLYEDGSLGEVFITISKEGSTIAGLMDTIATLTSLSLQYGVPLETLVNKFSYVRFEPAGFTNNGTIKTATSIVDYVFRFLGENYSTNCDPSKVIVRMEEEKLIGKIAYSAPLCPECGSMMIRSGSCYTCQCGFNSGCG